MKKLLIIVLLAAVKLSVSQTLPMDFKITPEVFKSFKSTANNQFRQAGRFMAAPEFSPTIISNFISDVIIAGNDVTDTIWFGTGKGISRTINNGLSFQNYYGTAPFGEDDVSGVAVYKNWVVVATATSMDVGDEKNVPFGTGIKVSSDYGNTWNAYAQPQDYTDTVNIQYGSNVIKGLGITSTGKNLSYDILITKKNNTSDTIVIWLASWAGGIRKSTDFGATFHHVLTPPDSFDTLNISGTYNFFYNPVNNGNHKGFSLAAMNDSVIYAGTSGGINRSTDWGQSWIKFRYRNTGSGTGISGNFVVGMKMQRFGTKEILWAATNFGEGEIDNSGQFSALSYTSNAGVTWANTLEEGLFSHNMGFQDSIVYGATDNGIWRSYFTPPNFAWSKPSVIYDEQLRDRIYSNNFYAVTSQGDSVWVGSGDGLARTVDSISSPWAGKWKIFRAYQTLTSTNETYAAPNPFSPDDEVCRIYFKTGKTSAAVTIKLFDFAMFPVRTVIQNAQRSTPDMLWAVWDGKRDDGSQVVNGVYFYRIEIDKDQTVWGKILVMQ
ncbi:MAG: hypothetical protein IAE90_05390 [Ignavibacteria bacterium]|nr:hypothetical protein [Ignavibacteria bacterium]